MYALQFRISQHTPFLPKRVRVQDPAKSLAGLPQGVVIRGTGANQYGSKAILIQVFHDRRHSQPFAAVAAAAGHSAILSLWRMLLLSLPVQLYEEFL